MRALIIMLNTVTILATLFALIFIGQCLCYWDSIIVDLHYSTQMLRYAFMSSVIFIIAVSISVVDICIGNIK